jgi:hypothetical protein
VTADTLSTEDADTLFTTNPVTETTTGPVPDPYENNDGVVYWDTGALRWLPLPGRPVPPEPDPADMVAVMFTRPEVVALFGLLQWANQRSLGLAVQAGVRDAWVRLSLAYGQSRPDHRPGVRRDGDVGSETGTDITLRYVPNGTGEG